MGVICGFHNTPKKIIQALDRLRDLKSFASPDAVNTTTGPQLLVQGRKLEVFFECFCEHKVAAKSDRDSPRTCAEKILAASIQSTKISLSGNWWCKHLICKELGVLEPFDNLSTGLDW